MSSDDKVSQALAAYIRKHPEVLSLLPKGQSEELDALCKRFSDELSVGVNVEFLRKHSAILSPLSTKRERPAGVFEVRQRIKFPVDKLTHATVPLKVDASWFAESCVGIHSVRVVSLTSSEPSKPASRIEHAEIVRQGQKTVEWGEPADRHLFHLLRLFACGEEGDGMRFGDLPFASSFEPDRCWLPIPVGQPDHYSLQLVFDEALSSVEVEFTCMIARGGRPIRAAENILLPRVEKTKIDAVLEPGASSFSFELPRLNNCVGLAIDNAVDGRRVWIEEANVTNERSEVVARWHHSDLHTGARRKFGDVSSPAYLETVLLEFGPFMRDPSRATTIVSKERFTMHIRTDAINEAAAGLPRKIHLYMLKHEPVQFQ